MRARDYDDGDTGHEYQGEIGGQGEIQLGSNDRVPALAHAQHFPARERAQYAECAFPDFQDHQRGEVRRGAELGQARDAGQEVDVMNGDGGSGGLKPRQDTSHRATCVITRCSVRGSTERWGRWGRYLQTSRTRKGHYGSVCIIASDAILAQAAIPIAVNCGQFWCAGKTVRYPLPR